MRSQSLTTDAFLDTLIADLSSRKRSAERLPSIAKMAHRCGVSYVTMWKAVRRYRNAGRLTVVPGAGVLGKPSSRVAPVNAGEEASRKQPPSSTREEAVRRQIVARIVHGQWPQGEVLPGPAEMARLLACSNHTLTQALKSLTEEGWLVRDRRKYRAQGPLHGRRPDVVVVICHISWMQQIVNSTPFSADFWRFLLNESRRRGVTVQVRGYHNPPGGLKQRLYEEPRSGVTLGFLIYALSIAPDELREIIGNMHGRKTPAVVYDESANPWLAEKGALPSTVRAVSLRSARASGFDMGRYLLSNGHRSVVYFMSGADYSWEAQRGEGMREAFERAGLSSGLRLAPAFPTRADYEQCLRGHPRLRTIRKQLRAFQRGLLPSFETYDALFDNMRNHWLVSGVLVTSAFESVFRQAQQDGSVTAWVGANDEIAAIAGAYIFEGSNRRGPTRVSIFGFDNRVDVMDRIDATYEFNVQAAVGVALESILNPARIARYLPRFHEIAGTVVEHPLHGIQVS
jgi:DNA-binding transcriptional regulator YhcF (GntR family)/DNA-binding LacI/PurR family transcriptional regulator